MSRSFFSEQIEILAERLEGTVEVAIIHNQPGGRVKFAATYWPAKFYQPSRPLTVLPGEPVVVVGRQGITLLVMPV